MSKKIISEQELHRKIDKGIDKLGDLIGATMSSRGKRVLIESRVTGPQGQEVRIFRVTKDGVTIAREYQDEDTAVNLPIQVLVGAGVATNEEVDDGTSATISLGRAIYKTGKRKMGRWTDVNAVGRGIDLAVDNVREYLGEHKKDLVDYEERVGLAMTSCVNKELAKFVNEIVGKADGSDIVFKHTPKVELRYEVEPAFSIAEGIQNTTMIVPKKTLIENPYILIHPRMISDGSHLMTFLNEVVPKLNIQKGGGVVIFSQDIIGACNNIVREYLEKMGIFIFVVKLPTRDENAWPSNTFMEDLEAFTGAKITDVDLNQVTPDQLAQVDRVLIDKDNTVIINADGPDTKDYISSIDLAIEEESDQEKIDVLEARKQKLSGKIVAVYHKASTKASTEEERDRLHDAIPALQNALQAGWVVGGGIALLNAQRAIATPTELSADEKLGFETVIDSLSATAIQILKNTGLNPKRLLSKLGGRNGYNVNTSEIVDLVDANILDPFNVVYVSLRSGARAAKDLLTLAGAVLVNDKK